MQGFPILRFAAGLTGLCCFTSLAAEPLPYDHMHLIADDRDAAHEWYIEHMGATMSPRGDRVLIGDVMIVFFERDDDIPGSEGTSIDHFGLSFPDLEAKMREFEAAGIRILAPIRDVPGLLKFAFIEDPWGSKIEVVEDREMLGFHHVHLNVPDPEQTFAWYAEHLGGERGSLKGRIDGVYFGNAWLLARQADDAPSARGHAIDHLGWLAPDVDALFAELEQAGVEIGYMPREFPGSKAGLAMDQNGVAVDLVQREF